MQLLKEIISLIFRYHEEYIYFPKRKQNNLICTLHLHGMLNDKYLNVRVNRKRVMYDLLPWVIYISYKDMNEDNILRYYKMEIYKTVSLLRKISMYPTRFQTIEQFYCFKQENSLNMPFEEWTKSRAY